MEADGWGIALLCMGQKEGIELGSKLGLRVVMVGQLRDHRNAGDKSLA